MADFVAKSVPYFLSYVERGYHERSLNSNSGWAQTAGTSLMNTRLFTYAGEIDSAVLMIHGGKSSFLLHEQGRV